jgi:hypothetical protein
VVGVVALDETYKWSMGNFLRMGILPNSPRLGSMRIWNSRMEKQDYETRFD